MSGGYPRSVMMAESRSNVGTVADGCCTAPPMCCFFSTLLTSYWMRTPVPLLAVSSGRKSLTKRMTRAPAPVWNSRVGSQRSPATCSSTYACIEPLKCANSWHRVTPMTLSTFWSRRARCRANAFSSFPRPRCFSSGSDEIAMSCTMRPVGECAAEISMKRSLSTRSTLSISCMYSTATTLPFISHTKLVVGDVSNRSLSTFGFALRLSSHASSSSSTRRGRSDTSANRTLKGRLFRCWLMMRQYFPSSGYVVTFWKFAGRRPAIAPPIAKAAGEIMYCRDKHCTMSKWKETQSFRKRCVVGTSSIITSSRQRPNVPSSWSAQRWKCSTSEANTSSAVMGDPSLSRCTKSAICILA
mmetsp:Transcript_137501/g.383487  ORF Transcript_137501/g.383487 Transcript_137501/m.383487 type:complete len:356 (+) Transcript_137501:665-1732(+)